MSVILWLACTGGPTVPGLIEVPDDTATEDSADTGETGEDFDVCEDLPEGPFDVDTLNGFTNSEDFAFDTTGRMYSVNWNGHLVYHTQDGDSEVVLPRLGEAAGMEFAPDGTLVVANVSDGAVVRVNVEDGSAETLMSGIPYPNGVTIDPDGVIYVSEHSRGNVRRYFPETGESELIAEGLYNPNGMAFSPDWQTLYVNSFGGGTVHAIHRDGEGFSEVELLGSVLEQAGEPCETRDDGEVCIEDYLTGQCESGLCVAESDTDACDALAEGDPCITTRAGESFESVCATNSEGSLICPQVDEAHLTPCIDKSPDATCKIKNGGSGYCLENGDLVLACLDYDEWEDDAIEACQGKSSGEACQVFTQGYPYEGECIDYGVNYCLGDGYGAGGLDGLDVDECGNVYVTEYIAGIVWRMDPESGDATNILELNSSWIPNLHWGSGVGGWEEDILYVMDRDTNNVYAVDIGLKGRPTALRP